MSVLLTDMVNLCNNKLSGNKGFEPLTYGLTDR